MIAEQIARPFNTAVRLFPPAADRAAWNRANCQPRTAEFRARLFKQAEAALLEPIPELRATEFMRFVRDGNRVGYETPYFARRAALETQTLAESLEYRGRFLDGIIDQLWAIIAEPVWTLPAHCPDRRFAAPGATAEIRDPLPCEPFETVDLFSAETAMIVTQTLRLLGPELAAISPNLVERVRKTLFERVVLPFDGDQLEFWWREGVNNWTPWVVSNLIDPVRYLLGDRDPGHCERLLRKIVACADRFIERYPADGACDEGPGYWGVSPARLFWILEQLLLMTDGRLNGFTDPRVRKMGEYIVDSHLAGVYFSAFCDSPVRLPFLPSAVGIRYGERVGSDKLKQFANRGCEVPDSYGASSLLASLARLFWLPEQEETGPAPAAATWYPTTEQLFAKTANVALAAKAGHNGEGHNHNDVGQFILLVDEQPFVVDLGCTEYTRFTFSEQRYENWQLTSLAHNVPAVDGMGQPAGGEFRARDVSFREEGTRVFFEADLAGAYPAGSGLEQLRRVFVFDLATGILTVTDRWRANRPVTVETPFFTPAEFTAITPAGFRLVNQNAALQVELQGDAVLTTTRQPLTDNGARRNWGDSIGRFTVAAKSAAGEYTLRFTPVQP